MLRTCSVGYSNILFGIMVLEAYIGDPYRNCFGVKIRKVWYPIILMILIQISVPEASLLGHLCGILSGFIL